MSTNQVVQAQDYLVKGIISGRWAEGGSVPGIEEIAAAARISPHAVRRAFRTLNDRGILKSVRKRGTTVLRRPSVGRVMFMSSSDAHTNLLLQDATSRALVGAHLEVEFQPYLFSEESGFERLRQLAAKDDHDTVLVTLAQEAVPAEVRPAWEQFVAGFRYRVGFQFEDMRHLPDSVTVLPDPLASARLVADHLLSLGHRRIGVVAGAQEADGSASERRAAALSEMVMLVGSECACFQFTLHANEGPAAFARKHGCTAWWAINDFEALDHIYLFQQAGLRVPQDISVVGANDTLWAANPALPLTTLSLDPPAVAQAIAKAVEAVFEDGVETKGSRRQFIRPVLVPRASTARRDGRVRGG